MNIPLCQPTIPDMGTVRRYLVESFQSGQLSNFGPAYQKLHEQLVDYLCLNNKKDIVLTSSGHTALMTAYNVLDIKTPVMPAFTFESTRGAAKLQGIDPTLVDVDPNTGCITTEILEKIKYDYDSVVVVAALSTIPNLADISEFCKNRCKKLIIDGAATFGTEDIYNYGDAYCISFHATKTLSIGEGGAIILNRDRIDSAKQFINFGLNENKEITRVGINGKLSEYSCAIGLTLMDVIKDNVARRLQNSDIYKDRIGDLIPKSYSIDTVYKFLPIFANTESQANIIRSTLKENGIVTLQYYRPLSWDHRNSISLYSRSISLPIHPGVSRAEIKSICELVKQGL